MERRLYVICPCRTGPAPQIVFVAMQTLLVAVDHRDNDPAHNMYDIPRHRDFPASPRSLPTAAIAEQRHQRKHQCEPRRGR